MTVAVPKRSRGFYARPTASAVAGSWDGLTATNVDEAIAEMFAGFNEAIAAIGETVATHNTILQAVAEELDMTFPPTP